MLSREQQQISEYLAASGLLNSVTDDPSAKGLRALAASLDIAVASFGRSDMFLREAERCRTLGIDEARAKISEHKSNQFNDKGLRVLKYGREALGTFRDDIADLEPAEGIERELRKLRKDLQEALTEVDLKASDVAKIDEQVSECFAAIQSGNPQDLADFLEAKLRDLEKARRSEDRGRQENIPWWKAVAVAVALGIAVWGVFRCVWGWFGPQCSIAEGLSYVLIFDIAALVWRLC